MAAVTFAMRIHTSLSVAPSAFDVAPSYLKFLTFSSIIPSKLVITF